MRRLVLFLFVFIPLSLLSQIPSPESLGFLHIVFNYGYQKVDVLIVSKKGEETIKKPVFFFCQGSMPQPLIKFDEQGTYGLFPFNPDSLKTQYHLVIIGKPGVPLISYVNDLNDNFMYLDSTGNIPKAYAENNLPDYYVSRNKSIIKYLRKLPWVDKSELVIAGHSEGSTIAAKMALKIPHVTHLIYSGGNPMGRIMSMIQRSRSIESDSTALGENEFIYWQKAVDNKTNLDASQGDTDKATYEFSTPLFDDLLKLKIPVLVSYGTKDYSAPFNDYLRVEAIRRNKSNFEFKAYIGAEHNYFPLLNDGKPNYEVFNWDKVAHDWLLWIESTLFRSPIVKP